MSTNTQTHNTFEDWFNAALGEGLSDIKLAITNSRGASVRLIQEDIMNIDALVKAGRTKELPLSEHCVSDEVDAIIKSVKIN
jgi:hypothetical protein